MLSMFLRDKPCWLMHMALDRCGGDPPGVKVRPSDGFVGADFIIAGYWVWAKLIENLADIGYDMSSMCVFALSMLVCMLVYRILSRVL